MAMLDTLKKDLFEEDRQHKKNILIAIGLAVLFHILLFAGVRNFKSKPRMYDANKHRKIFKPLNYVIPKKKMDKKKIKKTNNIYKPRNRPIPKAVPDPKIDEDQLPEIPEDMIEEDTSTLSNVDVGAIIPPMVVKKEIPEYPDIARTMGLEGTTKVVCTLDEAGNVTKVRLYKSSGADALDKAALNAAKRCRFTPAIQGDQPVGDIDVELTFIFKLSGVEVTTEPQ